jgi:hypothetical protein
MRRAHLLLGPLLLLAVPDAAQGQTLDFGIQCFVAQVRACATLQTTLLFHQAINRSELRFRFSNLQGLPGYATEVQGIKEFQLHNLASDQTIAFWNTPRLYSVEGNAIGNAFADATRLFIRDYSGSANLEFDGTSYSYGCDVPVEALSAFHGYNSTCGGFVTYSMSTQGLVSFTKETNVQFSWDVGSCSTGVDCVAVTPEPVSMILLGSGLAGIALARRRRRAA